MATIITNQITKREAQSAHYRLLLQQNKSIKSDGREDIFRQILHVFARSYRGMATHYRIHRALSKGPVSHKYILHLIERGIIREATEQEYMDCARYEMMAGHGQSFKPVRSRFSDRKVRAYINHTLKRLYVITEKGRKLLQILENMQELLVTI